MVWVVRVYSHGGVTTAAEWQTIGEAIEYALSHMNGSYPASEIVITRHGEPHAE